MNLRDVEYLVAVADTGQFGLAAERCHVSQPTLSMQLKKLEQELGVVLFERTPRGAVLTAEGKEALARARVIVDEVRLLKEGARNSEDPFKATLGLGVIPTAGPYLLPQVLPRIHAEHPRLRLLLREATTARLLDQLRNMELDAAVLSPPFDDRGLEACLMGRERLVVALPPHHRLAATDQVEPATLAGETLLTLEEGHCFREQALRLSHRLNLKARHEIEAASIESLRQMVSVGTGFALLPELATTGPFAQGARVVVRRVEHPDAWRTLVLAWRRSHPHQAALRTLTSLLGSVLAPDREGSELMRPPTGVDGGAPSATRG